MFCGECGTQNPETNSFCKNCGKPLRKAGPAAEAAAPMTVPVVNVQPVGAPGIQPAVAVKPSWPRAKKLAVVSIICGIGAFIVIPYILGILGIIAGAVSLKDRYYLAAAGIIISIGAMLLNYLYIFIF